jgi:cobalt/nickel transport protein
VGLETEIVPLTRPFGLYAGNVFQGRVEMGGEPVPHAQVEVEYYNEGKKANAPSPYMVTQVVRADDSGVFAYAPPKAGWWGFSALHEADYTLERKGEPKPVELGAVLWVRFSSWSQ